MTDGEGCAVVAGSAEADWVTADGDAADDGAADDAAAVWVSGEAEAD